MNGLPILCEPASNLEKCQASKCRQTLSVPNDIQGSTLVFEPAAAAPVWIILPGFLATMLVGCNNYLRTK
eukprot:1159870-Pelagomonas_calceolata.AAC.6